MLQILKTKHDSVHLSKFCSSIQFSQKKLNNIYISKDDTLRVISYVQNNITFTWQAAVFLLVENVPFNSLFSN